MADLTTPIEIFQPPILKFGPATVSAHELLAAVEGAG